MTRKWIVGLCCAAVLSFVVGRLSADEKKPVDPPKMTEAEQKAFDAWMKVANPGDGHKLLKPMEGRWDVAGKFRQSADGAWMESKSQAELSWILGGRFLTQKVMGEPMPGMPLPFEGWGMTGYNNATNKYESVWVDNMGTVMMYGEGTGDTASKSYSTTSKFYDVNLQKQSWMRWTTKFEGNDRFTFDATCPSPDGKEFTCMTLTYTRRK